MSRNRTLLYSFMLLGCLAAYGWLLYTASSPHSDVTVCFFKNATGIPCPSCGSTRSVVSLANGDFAQALQWNPLGLLIAAVLIIAPWWIAYDLLSKRSTLPDFIDRAGFYLRKKWIAAPAIVAIVLNWMWNISKGL